MLDLTTTSLFGLLTSWGERAEQLEVTCDQSKPVQADILVFNAMVNRAADDICSIPEKGAPVYLQSEISFKDGRFKEHAWTADR